MDALRQLAVEQGVAAEGRRRTVLFQQAFLDNIRRNGRLVRTGTDRRLQDQGLSCATAASPLLVERRAFWRRKLHARGKFHFRGERVKIAASSADFRAVRRDSLAGPPPR